MQELVEKASILIEALPYIKNFRGKEILIKYGGSAMTDPEVRRNVLLDLVFMNYVGMKPILIHGGGIAITENLKKRGVQSQFVNGLRVTDKATINVVVETLAEINRSIVKEINDLGAKAIGLSGHDAKILHVVKHNSNVGYVGDVVKVNIKPIRKITDRYEIPVIYPVGIDAKKETYNVNADDAAAEIAAAMGVEKLMVLTNVKGIMTNPADENTLLSSVRVGEMQDLIDKKIVTGGMIPKVNCFLTALQGGVKKAHIVDGRIKHSLLLEIFTDKGIGTEMIL
ncbi:MAG: acetylglutamate kinase [Candidatus Omnitrophica bacterium]|nr:acetylglutamate kinase [Candidatus Omnitrophota bacterium]